MEKTHLDGSFRILNSEEIIEISERKNGKFIRQLKFNEAVIEQLNDDSFLVIPQGNFKGINVFEKPVLDSMINRKQFPKETDSDSFYELFGNRIACIEDEMTFFNDLFLKQTGLSYDFDLSDQFIDQLNIKLNKLELSEKNNVTPLLSILINESFKREINGKWIFDKIYSLNTFQIPSIQDGKGIRIDVNKIIYNELSKNRKVDLLEALIHLIDSYVIQKVNVNDFNRKELYISLRTEFNPNYKKYLNIASKLK